MAERTLPGLGLTGFWDLGANNWKGGMDLNLRKLSLLVQLSGGYGYSYGRNYGN